MFVRELEAVDVSCCFQFPETETCPLRLLREVENQQKDLGYVRVKSAWFYASLLLSLFQTSMH